MIKPWAYVALCVLYNAIVAYADNLNCTAIANSDELNCNGEIYKPAEEERDHGATFFIDLAVVLALVIVAGIMSGLTLGLLSLDTMNLEIIIKAGEPKDSANAKKILPLVKKHHLLLVTLLLANAAAMETLPLFLDKMVPTWAAILLSVTLVLLFGEIIPQALCSKFGLSIGAGLSWLVWGVMGLLFVIAWPLSKILDFLLGTHENTFFRRGELKELLHLHGSAKHDHGQILTVDETTIMQGALDMKDKIAQDVMTPIDKVFMLEVNTLMDKNIRQEVANSGRSRIPIYRGTKDYIIGVLLVKSLLTIEDDVIIDKLPLRKLPTVPGTMLLYNLLNQFQMGKSHMAVVLSPDDSLTILGVVTLEDVIEELIQEEIYDEADIQKTTKSQGSLSLKLNNNNNNTDINNPAAVVDINSSPEVNMERVPLRKSASSIYGSTNT